MMSESTPVQGFGLMADCHVTNTSPWPCGEIEQLLLTNRTWRGHREREKIREQAGFTVLLIMNSNRMSLLQVRVFRHPIKPHQC